MKDRVVTCVRSSRTAQASCRSHARFLRGESPSPTDSSSDPRARCEFAAAGTPLPRRKTFDLDSFFIGSRLPRFPPTAPQHSFS
jgi:hypothetical protein